VIETRLSPTFAAEFKLAGAQAAGEFTGYASTFNGPADSYGDVIVPGAFAATLKEHQAKGTVPALLWHHDASEPIGRFAKITEDRVGLAVSGKLTTGTRRGAEARELMRDGALGLSIGFRVRGNGSSYSGQERILRAIDLIEISVVSLPANPAAVVTGVKSMAGVVRPDNIRDFEAALRDACGFSVREAKRIASAGWPALLRRDDASDELREVEALLRRNLQTIHTLRN
jgi:HK97 family phage prohead protease